MAEQYREYADPITGDVYRDGVRGGKFVVDKELTAIGFNGVEDTDWENISEVE